MPAQAATKLPDGSPRIERHKTALSRADFSRPIARALFDGLITEETTVFDYGCGRGGDVKRLSEMSIDVAGFDPEFAPETELRPSRIVNLGFVVNVIEDPEERAQVLRSAWDLTEGVLIVSARLMDEARRLEAKDFGDGFLTDLGTFQKFYEQGELREWIMAAIGVEPIAAEPGVFYVFRNVAEAQLFLLTRVRRNPPAPRKSEAVFEDHEEILNHLMDFFVERGRLPRAGEFLREAALREAIGTPREAWRIIMNITGDEMWDRVRIQRYEDLLVYLALLKFRTRPRLSEFPEELQSDFRDFFGSYKAACQQADRALLAVRDQARICEAIKSSPVGWRLPEALYVHMRAVQELPTTLRTLEGCAQELLGSVSEECVVRYDALRPTVAYLACSGDSNTRGLLVRKVFTVDLQKLEVRTYEYSEGRAPRLSRKVRQALK